MEPDLLPSRIGSLVNVNDIPRVKIEYQASRPILEP